jgi:hypothetical protein
MHACVVFFGSAVKILEDVKAHVCFSVPSSHSHPFSNSSNNTHPDETTENTRKSIPSAAAASSLAHQQQQQQPPSSLPAHWKGQTVEPPHWTSQSSGDDSDGDDDDDDDGGGGNSNDRTPLLQYRRSVLDRSYASTTIATSSKSINAVQGSHRFISSSAASQAIPIPRIIDQSQQQKQQLLGQQQQPLASSSLMEMMHSWDHNSYQGRSSLDTPIGSLSLLQAITTDHPPLSSSSLPSPSSSPFTGGSQFMSVYDMTHEEMQRHVLSRARLLSERGGGYTQNVLRSINNYPSLDASPPPSPSSSSWKQQSTITDDIEAGHVRNHLSISNKQVSLLSSELAANKDRIGE